MKITTRGTKPNAYPWVGPEWFCSSCQSTLEFGDEDVALVSSYDDDYKGEYLKAYCPVCEQERSLFRNPLRFRGYRVNSGTQRD